MPTKNRQTSNRQINILLVLIMLSVLGIVLNSCGNLSKRPLPTPLPTEYLPTHIALTFEAGQVLKPIPTESNGTPTATEKKNPTSTKSEVTQQISPTPPPPTPSDTPTSPTATAFIIPATPTFLPAPQLPNAEIEFRNLSPLSRVASPLHVYSYLKTGATGRVQIELLGEDNRLLYREVKVITYAPPGAWAIVLADIDFEIAATAEAGRLQISVDDEYGRTMALNSIPLILLSVGDSDITPPLDARAPIVIQEPTKRNLIQGGTVLVSGLVRSSSEQPLMVTLIAPKGEIVGSRLAGMDLLPDSTYGRFSVEVPYNINQLTNVRVVVSEGATGINDVIHLSSVEVMLSP